MRGSSILVVQLSALVAFGLLSARGPHWIKANIPPLFLGIGTGLFVWCVFIVWRQSGIRRASIFALVGAAVLLFETSNFYRPSHVVEVIVLFTSAITVVAGCRWILRSQSVS